MGAKHAFLLAGFGWSNMPLHMVAKEIKAGSLAAIKVESFRPNQLVMPMRVVYRKDAPPGPAGRTFISQLRSG